MKRSEFIKKIGLGIVGLSTGALITKELIKEEPQIKLLRHEGPPYSIHYSKFRPSGVVPDDWEIDAMTQNIRYVGEVTEGHPGVRIDELWKFVQSQET